LIFQCPGSSKIKRPEPETIICQNCGKEIEIWTDEGIAVCPKCKNINQRDIGSSCLDWCKYAKECVGEKKYTEYQINRGVKNER
jgi:hypothetical protein